MYSLDRVALRVASLILVPDTEFDLTAVMQN